MNVGAVLVSGSRGHDRDNDRGGEGRFRRVRLEFLVEGFSVCFSLCPGDFVRARAGFPFYEGGPACLPACLLE